MQRFITALIVLTGILQVNSYMLKSQPYNSKQANGGSHPHHQNSKSHNKPSGNEDLDSIVLTLNTGIKKILEQNNKADYFDKYVSKILNALKGKAEPMFRAVENKQYIKPQQVQLNADRPSTKFEINANVISNVLNDILKSDMFKENFDKIVKQASIIYRSIKDEEDKKN